ncbi:arginine/serine-rich protein 1 isoform X2 [Sphaeramia orbicularis]|uniref:arginine/serine-rich protein 1 isoform X2 n=1 Tax=Sphaeramia orbicularis TaxID=375764 RepID=UPI00117D8A39|nr:arginine/serine-rich protein 1 isoform X2 [Sphaeramia orbicularis]
MAKRENPHTEMADARQSDCLKVIFDQQSPALFHPRSRSRSSSSSGSSRTSESRRGRSSYRRRHRSSSSSSSSVSRSRSTSRTRSRSHPRCHRRSSRCRCDNHYRYRRYSRRSPPRRYRAHSRSFSRSPSVDRYSRRRHYRSRSRSTRRCNSHRRRVSRLSRSPPRVYRGYSRSSEHSVKLSIDDKAKLLKTARENAAKILGVETLELPKSVKPILSDELVRSEHGSPAPEMMGRQSEKTQSQNEVEPDDLSSLRISPKRRIISFSIHNSVAKPTVAVPSCAKVTPRVDSYESRKPYGHWIPVVSSRDSLRRKRSHVKVMWEEVKNAFRWDNFSPFVYCIKFQ